jgi:hypothetical protein
MLSLQKNIFIVTNFILKCKKYDGDSMRNDVHDPTLRKRKGFQRARGFVIMNL